MSAFLVLKYLHILSAVRLFGVGAGTAFHLYHAHRARRRGQVASAANSAVAVDLLFTAPQRLSSLRRASPWSCPPDIG